MEVMVEGMYEKTTARVVVGEGSSEEFEVKIGLRQGSVLSPLLFISVLDLISRNTVLVPFRQFVSPLAMAHNDVGETSLKRALNLIWARTVTCCHLQHISKLNCTVYALFR